jgi:Trk K+ transport system NAD-binding subunit
VLLPKTLKYRRCCKVAGWFIAILTDPFVSVQVSVKKGSPIVGQSIRNIGFRGRFNAAVIAVKRSKVRQPGRLGDLVLQEKDVLVISTGGLFDPTNKDFTENFEK